MSQRLYLRPLPIGDPDIRRLAAASASNGGARPPMALAGGPLTFTSVETLERRQDAAGAPVIRKDARPLAGLSDAADRAGLDLDSWLERTTSPRPPIAGMVFDTPRVMGVLNVTPDSFSDGGVNFHPDIAIRRGLEMAAEGAEILDVGGESTRPGADPIPAADQIARVIPVIRGLREGGCTTPISIDTRSADVARAAFGAGASVFNDVSALSFDPTSASTAAELCAADATAGVILCHSQGDPATMQTAPRYDDVCLDVYDALAERMEAVIAAGVPETRIILDPGIGFGKTLEHNLELIRGVALFHGLGRPVLLGASRKRFIGVLSGATEAAQRGPGSIAAGLLGVAKGAQILRVHDVAETAQALRVWSALTLDDPERRVTSGSMEHSG